MIEMLNRKFDEFDKDKNGVLSLEEVLAMSDTDETDAKSIMEHFDMNGDDQVEREEFKHVGLLLLSNQQFKAYDVDKDGVLSAAEFTNALKTLGYEEQNVQKIFERADMDKSGAIDRFEFLNALMHMISPQTDASSSLNVSSAWKSEEKRIRKSQGANDGDDDDNDDLSQTTASSSIIKSTTSSSSTSTTTKTSIITTKSAGQKVASKGLKRKGAASKKGPKSLSISASSSSKAAGSMSPRRKKRKETFATYIFKVLKQVHPQTRISSRAMSVMDSFVGDLFGRLAAEAAALAKKNNRQTLSSREIQTAVRLLLPGELAKHAVSEGTKAVTKFTASR